MVKRADGSSIRQTVSNALEKLKSSPEWRGGQEDCGGRPHFTTAAQDAEILQYVVDSRVAGCGGLRRQDKFKGPVAQLPDQ